MSKTVATATTAASKTMNGIKVARDIAVAVAPTVVAVAVAVVVVKHLNKD